MNSSVATEKANRVAEVLLPQLSRYHYDRLVELFEGFYGQFLETPLEADFIGIMCPGLPQASNQFCDRVGRVMNYGDGLYGGMFILLFGVLLGLVAAVLFYIGYNDSGDSIYRWRRDGEMHMWDPETIASRSIEYMRRAAAA